MPTGKKLNNPKTMGIVIESADRNKLDKLARKLSKEEGAKVTVGELIRRAVKEYLSK